MRQSVKNRCVLFSTICMFFAFRLDANAGQSFFDSGLQQFNAQQYGAALYEFRRAEREKPDDPTIQYYIGDSFAHLNQPQEAYVHFKNAFEKAPEGSKVKEEASAAMDAYKRYSTRSTPRSFGSGRPGLGFSFRTVPKGTLAPDDYLNNPTILMGGGPGYSARQNELLRDLMKYNVQAYGNSGSPERNKKVMAARRVLELDSSTEAQKLQAKQDLDDVWSDIWHLRIDSIRSNTNKRVQEMRDGRLSYKETQIADLQQSSQALIDNIMKDLPNEKGSRHATINHSQANLDAQLKNQKLTGSGTRLVPTGTNLNVRNYETYHSDDDDRAAVVPLIARPQKLEQPTINPTTSVK